MDWWPWRYAGLPLVAKARGTREMHQHGLDYAAVLDILESGDDSVQDRDGATIEKSLMRKGQRIKIVVKRGYDQGFQEQEVWNIVHVGPDTHERKNK